MNIACQGLQKIIITKNKNGTPRSCAFMFQELVPMFLNKVKYTGYSCLLPLKGVSKHSFSTWICKPQGHVIVMARIVLPDSCIAVGAGHGPFMVRSLKQSLQTVCPSNLFITLIMHVPLQMEHIKVVVLVALTVSTGTVTASAPIDVGCGMIEFSWIYINYLFY